MNIDTSQIPASLRGEPPARLAAFAMLYAIGDHLDWTQDSAGLEIAGLERPAEPERRTLPIAVLGPTDSLDDWRDALRIAGGMNRREPPPGHGGINILLRPSPRAAHPWILVDDLPPTRAASLCYQRAGVAVETSAGSAQAWLCLDTCLHHIERTTIAQALARRLGGDGGAANGSQFGRLSGFRQRKVGKTGWTNILSDTTRTLPPWTAASLLSSAISGEAPPCPTLVDVPSLSPDTTARPQAANVVVGQAGRDGDESAKEFAFACHRLRAGWAPERVEQSIAEHAISRAKRKNQRGAEKYAHHTVQKALQALGARP